MENVVIGQCPYQYQPAKQIRIFGTVGDNAILCARKHEVEIRRSVIGVEYERVGTKAERAVSGDTAIQTHDRRDTPKRSEISSVQPPRRNFPAIRDQGIPESQRGPGIGIEEAAQT